MKLLTIFELAAKPESELRAARAVPRGVQCGGA